MTLDTLSRLVTVGCALWLWLQNRHLHRKLAAIDAERAERRRLIEAWLEASKREPARIIHLTAEGDDEYDIPPHLLRPPTQETR